MDLKHLQSLGLQLESEVCPAIALHPLGPARSAAAAPSAPARSAAAAPSAAPAAAAAAAAAAPSAKVDKKAEKADKKAADKKPSKEERIAAKAAAKPAEKKPKAAAKPAEEADKAAAKPADKSAAKAAAKPAQEADKKPAAKSAAAPPAQTASSNAADLGDLKTANRSHSCGELRIQNVGEQIMLSGWVQAARDMNHFSFVDLRDRYGITQVIFPKDGADAEGLKRYEASNKLGREFVIKIKGKVVERSNKNKNRSTGDIEVVADYLEVLTAANTPPFKIEDKTDGQEEVRMRFRYLDIRRNPIKDALLLRNQVTRIVRTHLNELDFVEVETPVLIKSTPEGARDFVVPSRMNPGQFYALPQSPQTFKQLLMVGGLDRYFQIVKCFRDEELRADRQPEFTQIDCEMSFVTQEDILNLFEGMMRDIFKKVVNHEFPKFQRMEYSEAMDRFGIDKPDLRFDMELVDITNISKGFNFQIFDEAELVVGVCIKGYGDLSGKKVKELEKKAVCQEVGATAMVWVKCTKDGAWDSSAKKFFTEAQYKAWFELANQKPGGCGKGDLLCIFSGPKLKTQEQMGKFRAMMGTELGLREGGFRALWVVNFPMLEWDDEDERFYAKHHPFTSPWTEDIEMMTTLDKKDQKLNDVRANAYDCVINGVEVGGGSIRIHNRQLQEKVFDCLGFTPEEAKEQFGFLMNAFEFGAPPHGGLAFGLDRLCTLLGGKTSIRDFIAFPKNNMGRDMMIDSPSAITPAQLGELSINVALSKEKAVTNGA